MSAAYRAMPVIKAHFCPLLAKKARRGPDVPDHGNELNLGAAELHGYSRSGIGYAKAAEEDPLTAAYQAYHIHHREAGNHEQPVCAPMESCNRLRLRSSRGGRQRVRSR